MPTLDHDLAQLSMPYSVLNVCRYSNFAIVALRLAIRQLSLCFFDPEKRSILPPFVLCLFRTDTSMIPRSSVKGVPLLYPDPRQVAAWTQLGIFHTVAVFFVRLFPRATVYDLLQYLMIGIKRRGEYSDTFLRQAVCLVSLCI